MSSKNLLILLITFLSSGMLFAQDDLLWKNRIIYLQSNDQELIDKQIKLFRRNERELEERKIIVFTKSKEGFSRGFEKNQVVMPNILKHINDRYFFTLIGLDGGIKTQQNELMTIERLNAIIDTMPMRKSELKN